MCTAHVLVCSRANDDAAVVRPCAHRHHSDAEVGGDDPDWRARRHDHRGHQHVPELSSQSPTIHPLRIISFTCVTSYCNGLAPSHVSPLIYSLMCTARLLIVNSRSLNHVIRTLPSFPRHCCPMRMRLPRLATNGSESISWLTTRRPPTGFAGPRSESHVVSVSAHHSYKDALAHVASGCATP
jgi:hypothetical protein